MNSTHTHVIFGATIIALLMMSTACTQNTDQAEYQSLIEKKLSGAELLDSVLDFETAHIHHFESKSDLAQYYYSVGNLTLAEQFALRAESVIGKAPNDDRMKRVKINLYMLLAEICYSKNHYDDALLYIAKAQSIDGEKALFTEYRASSILTSQEKFDDAIKRFDNVYKKIPDKATPLDLRTYLYLLAKGERYTDCVTILNRYFEEGTYFEGLGAFASTAYEKTEQYDRAILCSYLEYEYHDSFKDEDDLLFVKHIETLEAKYKSQKALDKIERTASLVKTHYLSSKADSTGTNPSSDDFFAEQYLVLSDKINSNSITSTEVSQYLSLEKYFTVFPSYYWNAYKACSKIPSNTSDLVPLLERIIALGGNEYTHLAREQLAILLGINSNDCDKLLIPVEVQYIIENASATGSKETFQQILGLLSLQENKYELAAVNLLKSQLSLVNIEPLVRAAYHDAQGRIKEHLSYVLFG